MFKKIILLAAALIPATQVNALFIYHKDYNFNNVGSLIPAYLEASKHLFNNGHAIAARLGLENAFVRNFPRAYIDLNRPAHIKKFLMQNLAITKYMFHKPKGEVSQQELLKIHSPEYLKLLFNNANIIASICEMDFLTALSFKPFSYDMDFFRKAALRPILLATQGTLDGVDIALQNRQKGEFGWAINLGGGFHHAKRGGAEGEDYSKWGNCAISDEGLATLKALDEYKLKKVLIVDLDAHQGNGNAWVVGNDERVAIFDMYNSEATGNYPPDQKEAAQLIQYNYPLKRWTDDTTYLSLLKEKLHEAIEKEQPELIIYNAGSDPLQGDPEGLLNISAEGIKQRDEFVFETARKFGAAIVMAPSGGYQEQTAQVVAESLKNLFDKKIITVTTLNTK